MKHNFFLDGSLGIQYIYSSKFSMSQGATEMLLFSYGVKLYRRIYSNIFSVPKMLPLSWIFRSGDWKKTTTEFMGKDEAQSNKGRLEVIRSPASAGRVAS